MLIFVKRLVYFFSRVLVLTLAACAPSVGQLPDSGGGQRPGAKDNLSNTQWMLLSYGEPGAETSIIEGSQITLEFEEGGQVGGSGGCNSYGARYETRDSTLSINDMVSTLVACANEHVTEQEQEYFKALQTATRFEITDDHLTIWYDDVQGRLNFVKATSK